MQLHTTHDSTYYAERAIMLSSCFAAKQALDLAIRRGTVNLAPLYSDLSAAQRDYDRFMARVSL